MNRLDQQAIERARLDGEIAHLGRNRAERRAQNRTASTRHEWDDDAGCIHCGMDAVDWPRRMGPMPPCPVTDAGIRARNAREMDRYGYTS